MLEDPQSIKNAVRDHFKSFFAHVAANRPSIQCQNLTKVDEELNNFLVAAFTVDEVFEAVKSCDGSKAPGPDGYTMVFFKQFWSVIKDDVMRFFWGVSWEWKNCQRFEFCFSCADS